MSRDVLDITCRNILREFDAEPTNVEHLVYLLSFVKQLGVAKLHRYLVAASHRCEKLIKTCTDDDLMVQLYEMHEQLLLAAAPYDFESHILYMEWDRQPEEKFYPPRRKVLQNVVEALQDLADGKLRLLSISMPPGTGKTTIALFFITWLAGRDPMHPILTGSHSAAFTKGAYEECLRLISPNGEYRWSKVFPDVKLVGTNAKDYRIDLGKAKRFETLEFTTIGAGNAGVYRAEQLLYCDDLVSGLEVALNPDRLEKLWGTYTVDLKQRMLGNKCRELHIATRWSVHDVIGRLADAFRDDPAVRFIVMPALDADGKSNFNYDYGRGFTTEFYEAMKASMDDLSWKALYMNHPIEREGLLYDIEALRRYLMLPDGDPDAILAVCDTKDTGADYCCMPILYQYDNDFYVEEIICDNGDPGLIEHRLSMALLRHNVHRARFESNNAGGRIARGVQDEINQLGGDTVVYQKYTVSNKETKILVNSDFVKRRFLFKDDSLIKHDREYKLALQFLTSYTQSGRNAHDDVPDAFAQAAIFIKDLEGTHIKFLQRVF